jgi:uncharacterized RDD family membrane protein YckC
MTERQKVLMIQTPEGIVFPLQIASPVSRFLALVIDQICIYILSGILSTLLGLVGILNWDLAAAFAMLASAIVSIGYPILLEWRWRGQTIGKRAMHLQVMDEQGLRLEFSQIVIRNLLRVVDALPAFYLVGGIASFLNSRGQRLGDMAANTIVIRHPIVAEPDFDQILPGKYNSFREYPHLTARLRQNLSPREAGIALQALMRRDMLEDQARLKLFAELRLHMEEIVRFPPEITDGISDEQYVRNAVDVVFR